MIWATRSGSHTTFIGSPAGVRLRFDSCSSSAGANSSVTVWARSSMSVSASRSSTDAASSRERSSRSVVSLRSREVWSRTWSRKRARVSSSRSSSSSSSRKPPSEKTGVRSSCEAVAMKRRREESSAASWRCIRSSDFASWPSSSSPSTGKRAEKSPTATRSATCWRRATRRPSDCATRIGGEHREAERDDRGDDDPRAHEVDAALDVAERRGVDDDEREGPVTRVLVAEEQRPRGLHDAAALDGLGSRCRAPRLDGLRGGREVEVADVGAGVGVRADERPASRGRRLRRSAA